ncbi:MAG: hypothetical protein M1142_02415, partial [Patescibacteria group bacterium]|nr:hypothetical protein [Patescibacteria group bacterium]
MIEAEAVSQPISKVAIEQKSARQERNRLIAHLGRVFARRYDIQVLPSRQKGVWACSLDPKTAVEMESYVRGQRRTLDDLPAESFRPKQILYDEQSAQEMSMEQITTLMHHEAGHAKYTDFRLMVEGQKQAKDEGHLPTSFWLTFEGIEDPRVNQLEGEESPAIDRQIRANQARDLQERITEMPIGQRPQMLQFAYNSFHYWLHGKPIPELAGTDVGRVTELARPLLEQYFQNSDPEERKLLQKQIWDISKELEKKDIEQEEMRQMAQQKRQQQGGQNGQGGQPGGAGGQQQEQSGEGQESQSGSGSGGGGQGQESQGAGMPHIPGGSGGGTPQQQSTEMSQQGQESSSRTGGNEGQGKGRKRFLDRLKETIFGSKDKSGSNSQNQGESGQQNRNGGSSEQSQGGDQMKPGSRQNEEFGHDINKPTPKPKPEKLDLSKLSNEELQELRDAINQLTPEQRAELAKKAREAVDEEQKESLKDRLSKLLKLEKNKQTGEYEAILQRVDDKTRKQAFSI